MSMLSLDGIKLRRVSRALPLPVGGNAHRTQLRESIELVVQAGNHLGHGEAAPLPGYSLDSLQASEQALSRFAAGLPMHLEATIPAVEAACADQPPAARAALETALLDLVAKLEQRPLWALLRGGEQAPRTLPLAASLLGPDDQLGDEARALVAAGYTTLKRKLDASPARLALLAALQLGAGVALRLDANRGLDRAQLRALRPALIALGPTLLEEPLDTDLLGALEHGELSTLPIAIDESLAALSGTEALATLARHATAFRMGQLKAVVLKPARDGLLGALRLGQAAAALGAEVLVSHLWDGAIGHLAAAQLAFAIGSEAAHGLAPQPGCGEEATPARAALEQLFGAGRLLRPRAPGLGLDGDA